MNNFKNPCISLFFLFFVAVSCKSDKNSFSVINAEKVQKMPKKDNYKIVMVDSLTFNVNNTDVNSSARTQYVDSPTPMLIKDDKLNEKIVFYDWKTKVKSKEIRIPTTGKDAIKSKSGCFYDGTFLWVNDYNMYRIIKMDLDGNQLKTYDLYDEPNRDINALRSQGVCKLLLRNDKQAFKVDSMIYFYGAFSTLTSKNGIENGFHLIKFNLNSGKEQLILKYPETYSSGPYMGGERYLKDSYTINDNQIVYSSGGSPFVFIYDLDGNFIDQKPFYSLNKDTPKPLEQLNFGEYSNDYDLGSTFEFSNIFFDNTNKIYYRVLQNPKTDEQANIKLNADHRNFTIIAMDENFNYLDEITLDYKQYSLRDIFIGPRGLYISASSDADPNMNESKMIYHCFNVEKRK